MTRLHLPKTDGCQPSQGSSDVTNGIPFASKVLSISESPADTDPKTPLPQIDSAQPKPERDSVQPKALKKIPRFRWSGPNKGEIVFYMMPNHSGTSTLTPEKPWMAHFQVWCKNMPRLLREGFFWSVENIVPEKGRLLRERRPDLTDLGCSYRRNWYLIDQHRDQPANTPQWEGSLVVSSHRIDVLANFQMRDLTWENVYRASVYTDDGDKIYNYTALEADRNYNCFYDDMPMKGFWPWPREEGIVPEFPALVPGGLFPLSATSHTQTKESGHQESGHENWCVIL